MDLIPPMVVAMSYLQWPWSSSQMLAGRDPTTAIFERGPVVHPILTKVVFACKSLLLSRCGGLGDDLRPVVLAVLVLLHQNGNLWLIPQDSAPVACLFCTEEETCTLCPPGLGHHGSRQLSLVKYTLHRILRPSGASLRKPIPSGILALSASRGMAPREGLVLLMLKLGRTRPSMEPRGGLHTGRVG